MFTTNVIQFYINNDLLIVIEFIITLQIFKNLQFYEQAYTNRHTVTK